MMMKSRSLGKKAKTRELIFSVAMKLFLRQGYEATTVEQIVTEADVAKGTFFNHFPTKDAILADLGRQRMEEIGSKLARELWCIDNTTEKILRLFKVFGETNEESREMTTLVMKETLNKMLVGLEQEHENQRQLKTMFSNLILAGMKKGEFSATVDAERVSDILVAIYFFTLSQWVRGEFTSSLTEELTKKAEIILNGLKN